MSEPSQAAPAYNAGAEYIVVLKSPVRVAGVLFRPLGLHTMTGAFLARLIEENGDNVIDSATLAG